MRKTTFILFLLCMAFPMHAHTYVESSVLKSGTFVKIQVNTSGVYMLTYEQIQSYGLKPQNVRLLGYGGSLINQNFTLPRTDDLPSIPFYMHTGADGVFSAGDYILFYAKGPVDWEWNKSQHYFEHTRNCYADYGCYFLSDNAGEQRIMAEGEVLNGESAFPVHTYTALQLHEEDQRNLLDVNYGREGGGREWYGEKFTPSSRQSFNFTFKDVDYSHSMTCTVDAVARANGKTSMQVSVAGKQNNCTFPSISASGSYTMATQDSTLHMTNLRATSESMPVALTYRSSDVGGVAYLNYIEMQVPCSLHLSSNHLLIRNTEHIGSSQPSLYILTGAKTTTQVWNMTHPEHAYIVPTTLHGDTLKWVGSNSELQLFIAVETSSTNWSKPASRGKVANQDIHAQIRGKQHIIITPESFRYAAEKLKTAHEKRTPNQSWEVVTDEEVFNEFSSGTPDASAFRWMMKYLYDNYKGTDQAPRSLLLFGDGSFDNRKILKTSPTPTLLTYQAIESLVETQAYATDDYFGFLEDKDGLDYDGSWSDPRGVLRIAVGRLPINTYDEADNVVNKLIAYINNSSAGKWKQQLCFLADDGDAGLHVKTAETAAKIVAHDAPEFIINKIYLDAYIQETSASGETYPLAYNRFSNMLQTGVSLMDYSGHGSPNNICSELFLTRKQVESMVNANQGVWALATCNFARFDQTEISTAEVAVLNPIGGAIAVFSADRTVYASDNEITNKYFCQSLFSHSDPFTYPNTIGDAAMIAKNKTGNINNKMPYVLLGDPSLALNYPTQYQVVLDSIPHTLHAMDLVTIYGHISNGDTLSSSRRDTVSFNGQLSAIIFDKIQHRKTRDNDQPVDSLKATIPFDDYPNKIFTGETDVTNGVFEMTFRVPKDIRYNTDFGRLTFYALGTDDFGEAEAIGHSERFKVGGSSSQLIDDNKGPDIKMYLNTPLFVNGDRVNSTPHFFAELYDDNGINTVGSGIGHDLLLVLDNSSKQTYIMNDYFEANKSSYQAGTISYVLPELTNGNHSLSFRAWDMLNNASTQSIGFTVDNDLGPVIKTLVLYPNPVSRVGTLNIDMQNDRPDEPISMELTFYNSIGGKVWSTTQSVDGQITSLSMANTPLTPGVYIYQFIIKTTTQQSKRHNGRLIVY
ncbi:MAG: type IX secretion system sortase PorU [Paludibacteraceae bacterium]|nr:type IX secretion system sortase PorU [Paludibacteraceae bacterium]